MLHESGAILCHEKHDFLVPLDPEEFLNSLLQQTLRAEPFIKLK